MAGHNAISLPVFASIPSQITESDVFKMEEMTKETARSHTYNGCSAVRGEVKPTLFFFPEFLTSSRCDTQVAASLISTHSDCLLVKLSYSSPFCKDQNRVCYLLLCVYSKPFQAF